MADDSEDNVLESRFLYLLQPLRDLSANWDINIAHELEDYLEELDGLTFAFDCGGGTLNFAEAALLIQGTTCVFSKKVEYLHNLVYQALEVILSRRKDVQGELQENGTDTLVDSRAEECFYAILDDIKYAADIDLQEEAEERAPCCRVPATVIALEEQQSGLGDGDSGFYRLASCYVHCSGALLLDAKDGMAYDRFLQPVSQSHLVHEHEQGTNQIEMPPGSDDDDDVPYAEAGDGDYANSPTQAAAFGDMESPEPGIAEPKSATTPNLVVQQDSDFNEDSEPLFNPYKPLDVNDSSSLPAKELVVRRPPRNWQIKLKRLKQGAGLTTNTSVLGEFAYVAMYNKNQTSRQRPAHQVPSQPKQVVKSMLDWIDAAVVQASEVDANQSGVDTENLDDDGFYLAPINSDDDQDDVEPLPLLELDDLRAPFNCPFTNKEFAANDDCTAMSYEELCRAHMESLVAAAAAQETQTELAVRVSNWRSRIDPVLTQEESRASFDIQMYGERILSHLTSHSNCMDKAASRSQVQTFAAVAGSAVKYEVSRNFAAMLQLINNANLAICVRADGSFDLQLLDSQLLRPDMNQRPALTQCTDMPLVQKQTLQPRKNKKAKS